MVYYGYAAKLVDLFDGGLIVACSAENGVAVVNKPAIDMGTVEGCGVLLNAVVCDRGSAVSADACGDFPSYLSGVRPQGFRCFLR